VGAEYRIEKWVQINAPSPSMMRLQMARDGFHVDHWCDRPGTQHAQHKHAEAQSHWVISGTLELTVPSGTYRLEAGDRDYLAADTLHTARVIGEEPANYLIAPGIVLKAKEEFTVGDDADILRAFGRAPAGVEIIMQDEGDA
jgi:quercetin dioxygenase-like cupin family protein